MFKLQSKLQSMDVNKNTERYKFHPGHRAFMNSKNKINRTFDLKAIDQNKKINIRQNLFDRKNKISPIYFYRKVNTPYKYSMTSVPEYLIKTNEEKNFVDKLYQSIPDEAEKNLLNNLINKKKLNSRKDFFKPQILEVQNLLHYKPNFYTNPFNPDTKDISFQKKQRNYSLELNETEKSKTIKANDDKFNYLAINTCPTIENNSILLEKDKKKFPINNEIKDEISKDNQIKYKYKLSDVFNLRKEPVFTNKSAEKYLFKRVKKFDNDNNFLNTCPNMNNIKKEEKEENKFYTSSESKSDWIPNKLNNKKMGTHSSVAYNIISPLFKGENRFITATELNKNNLYNESPTFHRVKSISEFIDLTRVSATNTLECFNRNFNKKIPNFRFKASVATNQSDEYHINRDLIEKPI
jgi:hypothetical protein